MKEILDLTPTGSTVYIAAPNGGQFVPMSAFMELTKQRFYLVALSEPTSASLRVDLSTA